MVKLRSVPDFYDGKSVFITGGTGFLGNVFIAKLLLDCPKINKIYLLVREKKGVAPDKRVVALLDNPLFSRLRQENPEALKKIVPIAGDVTAPDLGINPDDERELIEKVSVVFHSAATVKFNQPLRQALKVNVEGTMQVLKLCQRMKNIQVMVHISTAYAYCLEDVIEEKLYPPPTDLTNLYLRLQERDDEDITEILNGWPNTYTFTKALAENYLDKHRGHVPIIIVRPSAVVAIEHGPLQGWLENWYGATSLLVPMAKGLNRVLLGDGDNLVDLIPVDYVTNLSIIAAAVNERPKDVVIYNACSSASNPVTLRQLVNLFVEDSIEKCDYLFPFPRINFITKYKFIVILLTCMLQITAFFADAVRQLRGKPTRYINLISRITRSRDAIGFFTSHSWIMRNDGVKSLFTDLNPQDQLTFPCDPTDINWHQYIAKYYDGVRRYLERKN